MIQCSSTDLVSAENLVVIWQCQTWVCIFWIIILHPLSEMPLQHSTNGKLDMEKVIAAKNEKNI